jgi:hypothetical protein
MNKLFCSNCGLQLKIIRKAIPKFGTIIDLVEVHKCLETPINPMEVIVEAPISKGDRNKFVESLNGLKPSTTHPAALKAAQETYPKSRLSSMTGTDDLRDRRFDGKEIPSTAPSSVLDQIKSMGNSIPANELKDDSTESEMGD